MSKFFTSPLALLLASVSHVLALEGMKLPSTALPPSEGTPDAEAPASQQLPVVLDAGRFGALAKKSPFTLASVTEENADFAKDLVLAGYVRMSGKDFVIVANRTRPERLMVGTEASPGAQGMVLVKLEKDSSGDPTKLQALVRKGTETATLKYEVASATPASPPATGGQAVPGQVPPATLAMPGQAAPGQTQNAAPAGQPNPPVPRVVRQRRTPVPQVPSR